MKKTILLSVLGLVAAMPSLAQESVVKQVERLAKKDGANYTEARKLIAPTLTNSETANTARAWYVAGLIEEKDAEQGYLKLQLGQDVDQPKFYAAIENMVNYYIKADSLDALPNEKGKVRRKYEKPIKDALRTYAPLLINAGGADLESNNFEGAHRRFRKFLDVKAHPMFEGDDFSAQDSTSMQIGFFSAYAASQIPANSKQAIAEYESIKSVPYRTNDVYQLLSQVYLNEKDTANYLRTLEEGSALFPEENYYLFNMINTYIQQKRHADAEKFLQKALKDNPNDKQLYFVLATVYEQGFNDVEKAETAFRKALEIDDKYGDAIIGLGRIYYNQAAALQSEANAITNDGKAYKEMNNKAHQLFEKSLPYFEKAVELEPDNMQYLIALRGIYYNLKMDDKYNKIEQIINSK